MTSDVGGRRYWRGLEELAETAEFRDYVRREFPGQADAWADPITRRRFLALLGASLALAGVAGCGTQPPPAKVLPYVNQPEELVLGKPLYYATAMTLGGFATGILVESHEGRPTKVEGNPNHPASRGATDLFAQAAVLGLYDPDRSEAVTFNGRPRAWDEALKKMQQRLDELRPQRGRGLRVLTEAVTSPTLAWQLDNLLKDFPEAKWHQYEPAGREQVAAGARQAFGGAVHVYYDLKDADVILSLDADLLACGPGHVPYVADFAASRRRWRDYPKASEDERRRMERQRLYVVESTPSNTGLKADHRLPLRAADVEGFARAVAAELQRRLKKEDGPAAFFSADLGPAAKGAHAKWIDAAAADLAQAGRGRTLVAAGDHQSPAVHALAHALNLALGNAGKTVFHTKPVEARPTEGMASLAELVKDMAAGAVEMLLILGGNPAYTAPADLEFGEYLGRVKLSVHLGLHQDETAVRCHWHVPEAHFLEAWGDARAYDGTATVQQPLIAPLYKGSKSACELLDALAVAPSGGETGTSGRPGYEIVRAYWRKHWPREGDFELLWQEALHDGVIEGTKLPPQPVALKEGWAGKPTEPPAAGVTEIVFRPDPTVYDGRFANNGWLQELPKPVTKLTWDNAALVSPKSAERLGLLQTKGALGGDPGSRGGEHGRAVVDVVELRYRGRTVHAPAFVLPGHPDDSVTVHLGYGRNRAGRVGSPPDGSVGFNAYRLRTSDKPWFDAGLEMIKTGERYTLACTQMHFRMEGRAPVREATLRQFGADPEFARRVHAEGEGKKDGRLVPLSLYPEYEYKGYKWAMGIDLTACTGCSACVVACQAENNIPVVGKAEVTRGREMHWLRIDRYFAGPVENPQAFFQPVPCMHCEKAPCELVCPVNATVHSDDGLNDMVYNRCVGTRYCSNNCPYKVRRFNFLQYADYATASLKLLYNPEVTVRSRGVMEKCTYCVQRIRNAEIEAEKGGRKVADGEVLTACQAACPAGAIVFGDWNDKDSEVARWKREPLDYGLLAELNTQPRTTYLAALRNPNPELEG